MRLFTPWFPPPGGDPERPPVLVRDGFSVWGLVFGWLVFLRPGSWLVATLTALATVLIGALARAVPDAWVLLVGLHVAIATFGAAWRGWELRQAGYLAGPVVAGSDRTQALLRMLDQRPDLVRPPA